MTDKNTKCSKLQLLKAQALKVWEYYSDGIWNDTRENWRVNLVKTINLSVRSFLNADLQTRAASLTYRTLLAVVPALALIFAIGRGFGFQNILQNQLFDYFPSQTKAIETALTFVDSYLTQTSQGIFVGIGIVFLLWTLVSLLGNVENSFNVIWGSRKGRSMVRKFTDYTAIFFILPVLMICASGISIFMSSTIQDSGVFSVLSPIVSCLLDFAPYLLTWLFFAAAYKLIPNAKVKFKYALLAGIIAGTLFQLLQELFVSGQIYVSKYNAIYGSFAFLPLLLIWLHLTWMICLSGAVICYSSQNIFQFNFANNINSISADYRRKISIATASVIAKRFEQRQPPLSILDFATYFNMPSRLTTDILDEMVDVGLLSQVIRSDEMVGYQPAVDINQFTLGLLMKSLDDRGNAGFIPDFDKRFAAAIEISDKALEDAYKMADTVRVVDLPFNIESTINRQ